MRTTSGPAGVASTPSAIIATTTSFAAGRASSNPQRHPRPRPWTSEPAGAAAATARGEPLPDHAGPVEQALVLDHVEHGERTRAHDRTAAERRCVVAGGERHVRAGERRAYRQPTAQGLRQGEHVGLDAGVLQGRPVPAPAEPRLHLVGD